MNVMRRIGHLAVVVCTLLLTASFGAPASADEAALDTSKLPRVAGTTDIYASPSSTIFTTPDPVAETAEATAKVLSDAGWQRYAPPFAEEMKSPTMSLASFKKGAQGLSVFINIAPAQNNATSVTYTAVALTYDLPFPKDATEIKYDPERPHLSCLTAGGIDATSDFFRTELIARGWSPWSEKDRAKAAYADQKTEKGLYAYYVRDQQKLLLMTLATSDGGKTNVKLESVPAEVLAAADKPKPTPPKDVEAATPEAKPADKIGDAIDALAENILKQAQQATADALANMKTRPLKDKAENTASETMVSPLAGSEVPLPLPATAEDVDFDGAGGRLEFNSSSTVKDIAAFYRNEMKSRGWTSPKSVIDQDNMVDLEFHKGEAEVSLTVLKMGTKTNVTAHGTALETQSSAASAEDGEESAAANADAPEKELEADEAGGLPIPKEHSMSGTEKALFRHGANASVPAKLKNVLDFYRRELGKREWKEDTAQADIKTDAAELHYASPEGPAILKLGRRSGETTVELFVREQENARKSGLMPKAGQTKLLFGNILDSAATITIAGKTIKVAGGAGSKAPDGPTLEVPPGKYTYRLKGAGPEEPAEPVEVGADEIWGIMIGPGGVLPLQMY